MFVSLSEFLLCWMRITTFFLIQLQPLLAWAGTSQILSSTWALTRGVGRGGSKGSDEPPFKLDFKKL